MNLPAALAALVILVGGFGLLNTFRGRPFWSLPTGFGIPEPAVFVLLPAVLRPLSEGPAAPVPRRCCRQPTFS